jgi:hypothetical protein
MKHSWVEELKARKRKIKELMGGPSFDQESR